MRFALSLIALYFTIAALPCSAGSEPEKKPHAEAQCRPNIIVFLVDDMGMMDTSVPFLTDANGQPKMHDLNRYYRTPSMERLAAQGIRFNNFYAMSVCSPTRCCIMTGQNAARHHITNWINPDNNNRGPMGPPEWNWEGLKRNDVTLAGLLQAADYHTIHVGKGHFGARKFEGADPANLGFTVNVAGASFGAPGSYYGKDNYGLNTRRGNHAVPHLEKYHGTDTFLTEALTIEANARITRAVEDQKPFYLYMAHYAVHAPFHSDPRFAGNYTNSGKSPQAQAFATLIEGMDKSLGDILDHLETLGVADNTLVLFVGDNGSDAPLGHQHAVASAAPLRGKKGAHYEGGMRVPFIAAWAKVNGEHECQKRIRLPHGAIQSQIAAVYDIFPTVLAAAGVKAPPEHQIDGRVLQPLLDGTGDAAHPQSFLMHYPHAPHRSDYFTVYRERDWKVIYHYHPSEQSGNSHYQLFNLQTDPYEQTDLAAANPVQLRDMMQKLIDSLRHHNAQYPLAAPGSTEVLIPELP